jgi:H+-transporting ATPase
LTTAEAARRLASDGPNTFSTVSANPWQQVLANFWAPVPWLLEAAVIVQAVLHEYPQAAIVFGLLVFNSVLGYLQSSRSQATLAALKTRLASNASLRRDAAWVILPAAGVVRGDVMKLCLGGVVPADARILSGEVLLDQSMLTGESLAVEGGAGVQAYAGALVRRGEAVAEVTATGERTKFGRTAELVRTAHAAGTQQRAVLLVVRNLVIFNGLVALGLLWYSLRLGFSTSAIFALILTAILASIPVALPATFTLAAAVGARFLAAAGVLPTRLSAVDEAASMDVLCCDKTGTLTLDELKVADVRPMPGFEAGHVIAFAALASDEAGQDPVDAAIRVAAAKNGRIADMPTLVKFEPFDPNTKMSAATLASWPAHRQERVVKGAFAAVSAVALPHPQAAKSAAEVQERGYRVLAVAAGPPDALQLVGFIAFSDSPRSDSADLIWELQRLGVRTVMVTGDAAPTAEIVAAAVDISGPVFSGSMLPPDLTPESFAVYADVLPDDKYRLVRAFEKSGHVVGMCGDGANDAPALRQAQMGIAVASATDIAKSAAGIVLTTAGLGGIVTAVKEGRTTFQRILTYTLNAIVKKLVVVMLLVVGLIVTRHPVLTPTLMVVLMLVGDFLAMSLTTDNVTPSPQPNVWRVGNLTVAGAGIALCLLAFCSGELAFGTFRLHLNLGALQTLTFVSLAFGTQATLYAIRERRHMWCQWPSRWLLLSSVGDAVATTFFALHGVLMKPLPWTIVAGMFAAAVAFALLLNVVKLPLFAGLKLS